MATVVSVQWQGVSAEEYDRVSALLNLEAHPAEGGILHVAGVDGDTLKVVDVWESKEAFERFLASRLLPAIEQAGLADRGRPDVLTYEARAFARTPGVEIPDSITPAPTAG